MRNHDHDITTLEHKYIPAHVSLTSHFSPLPTLQPPRPLYRNFPGAIPSMTSLYPVSVFLQRTTASPSAVALGLGLAASSYFFWGNLAIQNFGAAPLAINVGHRAKVGLSTKQALGTWAWAYKGGLVSITIAVNAVCCAPGSIYSHMW
jgi:hypothetical protein